MKDLNPSVWETESNVCHWNRRHRHFLARPKIEVSATSSRFERIEHGKKFWSNYRSWKKNWCNWKWLWADFCYFQAEMFPFANYTFSRVHLPLLKFIWNWEGLMYQRQKMPKFNSAIFFLKTKKGIIRMKLILIPQ